MKPFLILQLRPIDRAADDEFTALLKYSGLDPFEAHRIRMEKEGIPDLDLNKYSGIIVGGGPSNVSDDYSKKEAYQRQFEADLNDLLKKVFAADFPFLGVCYGMGALVDFAGGKVGQGQFSEKVGVTRVEVTSDGKHDDLLKGLPNVFEAYCGHKEACHELPEAATLLAKSENCPIQMIRFQDNIYATQFHAELDPEGIQLRIEVYKDYGYFNPEKAEEIKRLTDGFIVTEPQHILKRFVDKYGRIKDGLI